ncbi:MAG: hypothetical protein Kow0010_17210 [Dehalococcoidia bacterium]
MAAKMMTAEVDIRRGVYDTKRASALSGVPASTLHRWARQGLIEPSIAREPRTRLWSWVDLVALRIIDWLRRAVERDGAGVPHAEIRNVLKLLLAEGQHPERLRDRVLVAHDRRLFVVEKGVPVRPDEGRQAAYAEVLDLVAPYASGPDLLRPRPRLRIVPGKLSGEPHVEGTRVPSTVLYTLHENGYTAEQICTMYPEVSPEALTEAIDLERALAAAA